jgi:hypothetical protein
MILQGKEWWHDSLSRESNVITVRQAAGFDLISSDLQVA